MAAKLNNLVVPRLGPGNHADGNNLYLRVIGGSRTWAFRYERQGKTHWLSLGRTIDFTLAEARQKARECRRQLHEGVDLVAKRRADRTAPDPGRTFGDVAEEYIKTFEVGWRPRQAVRWRGSLTQHAKALKARPVAEVDVNDVLGVLEPIWRAKNETASKLRGRIEAILTYARAKNLRIGDNPAEWRGRLKALLPPRSDVAKVQHLPALPWTEIPATVAALGALDSTYARCAVFTILTAARGSEARGALWSEIDLTTNTWTIPAGRMKADREHRVPLSAAAITLLAEAQQKGRPGATLVFEGAKAGHPMSDETVTRTLHLAAGRKDVTVHGCRSSFRDWCGETQKVASEIAEAALAHVNPDKTERAYARTDYLEARRELMTAWAEHCTGSDSKSAVKRDNLNEAGWQ